MANKDYRFFYLMQTLTAGVSTRVELTWQICQNFGLVYPSGSATRLINRVKDLGLVVTEHVRLFRSGSFELIRLSQQGRQWCLVNGVGGQPGHCGDLSVCP